ncbi:MAG: hypothetical protein KBT66_15440 [Amphritea sp.]|nr:hypothetical protein [Amphritea sp.]
MLTASMVAFSLPESDEKHLCLIDQPAQDSHFVTEIMKWSGTPFNSTQLISRKCTDKNKHKQRKIAFQLISALLAKIQPDVIYTGNDRRVEFQYAMAHSPEQPIGVYIDDGTYTYLGRKTHWLKDHLLDNLVKKLSYGFWWKQPDTIGASDWIDECIVAFPKRVTPLLKQKVLKSLPENLNRTEFRELSVKCMLHYPEIVKDLPKLETLILLPHESVFDPSMLNAIKSRLSQLTGRVGIKHHPRTKDKSFFTMVSDTELPDNIPMEVILPLLNQDCRIIGDVSTALLTTKWLRPEMDVTAISGNQISKQWHQLLSTLGINIIGHN